MRVFLSHSSRDKPAVESLARYLREQGIDVWLDKWEISPGDDIIVRMNDGLLQADAGLIVFSAQSLESPWVKAEVSTLTYERIKSGQPLIPVQVGDDAYIPPLLKPLCRLGIEEHGAIADALLSRRPGPPSLGQPEGGRQEQVRLRLERGAAGAVAVTARIGEQAQFAATVPELPAAVRQGRRAFLRGFGAGARDWATAERAALESELLALGHALAAFCLAMAGCWLGFLAHNRHPARLFMGDTGSLAMGAALSAVALLSNSLWPLLLMGGVFLTESLSVILQVWVFKATKNPATGQGRRLFRMAPLHHHFELGGMPEQQVVLRFWAANLALVLLGLVLLP
jgi:hypothetical protein